MHFIKGVKAHKRASALPFHSGVLFDLYSKTFCLCASAAGVYEEDSQWMTQVNRLQKLIDRLEQKVASFLLTFLFSSHPSRLPPRGRVTFSPLVFTGSVHVMHKSANNNNPTMHSHIITLANMHINLDTHSLLEANNKPARVVRTHILDTSLC